MTELVYILSVVMLTGIYTFVKTYENMGSRTGELVNRGRRLLCMASFPIIIYGFLSMPEMILQYRAKNKS